MNPILSNGMASPQSIFEVSSTPFHKVGTRAFGHGGNVFFYAANRTAATPAVATLLRAVAGVANHLNIAQATSGTSVAIGMRTINVDIGATAMALGDYEEGWLNVNDVTGEGYTYKIRTHAGSAGGAPVSVTLYDPIQVAWGATTDVTFVKNPYLDCVASTTAALNEVGVTRSAITAGSADHSATQYATTVRYYWLQTAGECSILQGAVGAAIGAPIRGSVATAGAVDGLAAGTAETVKIIGEQVTTGVSTEHNFNRIYIRF